MRRYFLVVAALVVPVLALTAFVASGSQQSPAAAPTEVGSALGGVNAVEYVGRVDQNDGSFTSFGYLTHISGLTDTLLFSGTLPFVSGNETNAHFTFHTSATLTSRYVITYSATGVFTSSVFVIDAVGTTVYYYNPTPAGSFSNPASFTAGTPIVTATVRSQNILNVQGPNVGVSTNLADFSQTGVSPFTINGQTYQLGRVFLMERLFSTGEGIRTNPVTPTSFTVVAGNAVVTGIPGQQSFMPLVMHDTP